LLAACAPAATPSPTSVPPTATTAAPTTEPTLAPTPEPTAQPSPEPIHLADGLGRPITLAAPAQKIVSLGPSNTELLFALGAGAQVVGRDDLSDYPEAAQQIPGVGATYGNFSAEPIVALQPDLVLVAEIYTEEQVKLLSDVGLTVFWLANPTDFEGLYDNLAIVGQLTGHTVEASDLAHSLEARVAAVTDKVYGLQDKPKVFYEIDASDPTKPYTVGPGTFMNTLIALAGGENVGAALSDAYAQISSEELVNQDPDILLLGDAAYGVTVESVGQRPGWADIAAVKTGKVYAFDDNLASRPGPRLVDGLETLAELLHPELFQ
jgi:iron complex transport system substrate-binding protein